MEAFTVSTVFIHTQHIINLKKHERICNNYDYCRVDISKEHEKINTSPEKSHYKFRL